MDERHRPLRRNDFEVAIICALPLETNAVLCSLDEVWDDGLHRYGRADGDDNAYDFGRSGRNGVVVVTLTGMGKVPASTAASYLRMSFSSIKLVLLVGVCGAVPRTDRTEIVLGDVVISQSIVELDRGRQYPNSYKRKDTILDSHGRPNEKILGLLQRWKTTFHLTDLQLQTTENLKALIQNPRSGARYPGATEDKLFEPDYIHRHHFGCGVCNMSGVPGSVCGAALTAACDELQCDESRLVPRTRLRDRGTDREIPTPLIHFGLIGTADTVQKSAAHRDEHAESEGVIAFEMEGAGVWNKFNCLIIKGVCDYADSHKNKNWQNYAAAVAASVAKEILAQYVPHERPSQPGTPNGSSVYSTQHSMISRGRLELQIVPDSLPNDMFHRITKRFKEGLEKEQLDTFKTTDLRALKKELKKIQDEQGQSHSLRNLRRIERFIQATEQIGTVLEDILGTSEEMCLIWGPVKALLQVAKGNVDLFDTLLAAYEDIGSELPNLGVYRELFKHHVGLQRIMARVFALILEFHENALRLYSGRALRTVFRPLWKDFETTLFDRIVHETGSHRIMIEDKTMALYSHPGHYTMDAQEIRDHLESTSNDMRLSKQNHQKAREKMYDVVRCWIAGAAGVSGVEDVADVVGAETESDHNNICRDRGFYPGSGSWILENGKVKKWLSPEPEQSSNSMLWINGRPGTGKTYLASVIIETCLEDSSSVTCYFYCKEKVKSRNSAIAVLRGILLQLARQHRELIPYCYAKIKSSGSLMLSDLSTANGILEVFCERIPRLNVVIDGVDECEEQRKDLIDIFRILVRKNEIYAKGKLRVLFLSRPMNEVKNALPEAEMLALEPEHNRQDIQKYCERRKREFQKFGFDNEYLKDVVQIICTRADGMFLFAKLVMNNLKEQPTREDFRIETTAAILPREIDQAYARIMERLARDLGSKQYEYTELLLGWLVCSKRPLKWTEIQVALSTDIKTWGHASEVNPDRRLEDDVQELCGSLVQVLKGNRVELVHSTARLFIVQKSNIRISAAECDLALRCLRYLSFDIFRPDISAQRLRENALRGDFGFQDYAVSAWFLHVGTLIEKKHDLLEGIIDSQNRVARISRELEHFVSFYQESFPLYDNNILEQAWIDCEFFQQYPFHNSLVRIWNHICCAQREDLESRNSVSIPLLKETLARNRQLLENLSTEDTVTLSRVYDEYPFRCPKVLCFYFHEGFKNALARDNHVDHHNRPYRCTVGTCEMNGMGFAEKSRLTAHMKRFHPEERDLGETFTPYNRTRSVGARYECPICNKRLVRKNILEDHQRIHTGEKPFRCSECGKGFARNYDKKRHEKIHEKRRR
ncbi:hypothetical protein BDV33DRAFT_164515 [Aspergillus novoparasiticus]|uniref:C2H2-type domain-containing protein n=1 Tax=Aspergillus novoparasiticus TaxID=986946 RepID=A0A5N6F5E9_9EURO|nr:hypothetical protein BDV33DRAFT_164515 [Aspergillus novoparasiticus]